MTILFDQEVPVPLRKRLPGHKVDTALERGWSTLSNGASLTRAEYEGCRLFVTTDQNRRYRQNLAYRQLAIVVLLAASWRRIGQRIERILNIIEQIELGQYMEFPI